MIVFNNTYTNLADTFFTRETPDKSPAPELIRVNEALGHQLNISSEFLNSKEGLEIFSGQRIPDGAASIAQAYAGHQFGGWVPQLGDGRAILLGEVLDKNGNRFDIQLKGAGRTSFSRGGDGKSPLGPVLREYLVSEAMAALGVPTTRALAAVTTGESVTRQQVAPGAILTRVAASHIRVGTFQFFLGRGDLEGLRSLADYTMERHFPECAEAENRYREFLGKVIEKQAALIAQWMSLGFIHGVMNTDNMTVSGETIDYGPCAFIDDFNARAVFSSIDRGGRYAWGNQPNIGLWNLTRLAETLLPLLSEQEDEATELAEAALEQFEMNFKDSYFTRFRSKFGWERPFDGDQEFIVDALEILEEEQVDFTRFFRVLTQVAGDDGHEEELSGLFANPNAGGEWLKSWKAMNPDVAKTIKLMQSVNPIIIPRNHRVEAAIRAAEDQSDYSVFHRLVEAVSEPFIDRPEYLDYENPPRPDEVVSCTFCGT